jgi:malonyl-CoA O-methyltransferase
MSRVIDKQLVSRRFGRALHTYRQGAVIQHHMAKELVRMLGEDDSQRYFDKVLEVGSGSGILTGELMSIYMAGSYYANDLVAESAEYVMKAINGRVARKTVFLHGDIERIDELPGDFDLVISNATVQWLQDIGGFFRKMAACLKPGGRLVFSTFSSSNLQEIAHLEDISLCYHTLAELEGLASENFEIIDISEERRRIDFSSPEAVLHHIRQTGVNGLVRSSWTKSRYQNFIREYRTMYSNGAGVYLTYHPVYCCFRRKSS